MHLSDFEIRVHRIQKNDLRLGSKKWALELQPQCYEHEILYWAKTCDFYIFCVSAGFMWLMLEVASTENAALLELLRTFFPSLYFKFFVSSEY